MANKPLLWLRMADCCMGVLQSQAQPADVHPELSGVATHIGTDLSALGFGKPESECIVATSCPILENTHTYTKRRKKLFTPL